MKTLSREGIQRMIDGQGASSGGGGGIQSLAGYATQAWTEENYLSKPYFNQLFTVHTQTTTTVVDDQGEPVGDPVISYGTLAPNALPGTTETTDEETGYVTTVATVITSIEAKFGFWSQSFISALGQGSGGGGGGASALTDLVDVAISSVENGQVLMYDSTLSKWVNGTVQSGNYLPLTGGTMANTNLVTNMNADLLDGLNGADYLSRHNTINDFATAQGQKIISVSGDTTLIGVNTWGSLIQWGNSNRTPGTADNNTWYNQLIGLTNDRLYFRTRTNGGEWTTAKKIAFISDISDMATKTWVTNQNYVTSSALSGYASQEWVGQNYLSIAFFRSLFKAYTSANAEVVPNSGDTTTIVSIKAMFGFWTAQYISALGQNSSGGGGGGASALTDLTDVEFSGTPSNGQVLKYNGTTHKWYNGTDEGVTSLAWSQITDKPTTLAGYGITDAYTKTEADGKFLTIAFFRSLFKAYTSANAEVVPNSGDTTTITSIKAMFGFWTAQYISALGQNSSGGGGGGASALTDLTDVEFSGTPSNGQVLKYNGTTHKWYNGTDEGVTSLAWSQITNKPTTLAGYGITDAYTKTEADGRYLKLSGGTMSNTNVVTNMNADLLDGLNGADYLSRHNVDNDYDTTPGQKIITVSTGSTIVSEWQWGSLIQWGASNKTPETAENGTWYNQLIGMTNDRLYFRTRTNGGDWTTAKKIAFISDFSSWALASTKPSYAFSELTSHPTTLSGYGITDAYTKTEADGKFLTIAFFRSLFKAYTSANAEVVPNSGDTTTITSIKAMFGFWTAQYISALGQNSSGGGGGASALTDLTDVAISNPTDGQSLVYNANTGKWVNSSIQGGSTAWGDITNKPTTISGYGITDAYTKTEADGRYLKLSGGTMSNTNVVTNMNADLLDGLNGADYLSRHNVDNDYDTTPGQKIITVSTGSTIVSENQWGSLIQWGNSNKTPGTADSGTWYNQLIGMTNNCLYFRTRTNGGEWTTVKKIAFISDFSSWALASTKPSYAFSELTSHPTTLSGYGITDAYISSGTIYLGGNSITPLTSFTETDPTVPAWAKASTKPSYAFSELTSHPTTLSGYGITDAKIASGVITLGSNSITPLTASDHPSRSYTFTSNVEYTAKWHRLGNYKTAGNASNFAIILYTGSGYNANASQNSFARIVVKDGWQQTPAATNSVGVTLERFGNFDSSHEIKAVVVATSDREGALWVYLPWQYADGNYTISGVYDTWTHNSGYTDDTTTEPTSNQRDTGYFDIVYNKTYPQFSNLRLRNGTDNYGSYLYFGDGSNAFICEPTDDSLQYKVGANKAHVFTVGNSNKAEVNSSGLTVNGNLTMAGYIDGATNIELKPSTNSAGNGGYIDFHYNQSSSDYTSRIIEDASGRLYLVASNGIRIGDCVITWDATNNAMKVQKADGTAANLYATGGVSALGLSSGSGGSIGNLRVTGTLNIGSSYTSLYCDSNNRLYVDAPRICFGSTLYMGSNNIRTESGNIYTEEGNIYLGGGYIYLDSSRYIYLDGSTLKFYDGSTAKTIYTY